MPTYSTNNTNTYTTYNIYKIIRLLAQLTNLAQRKSTYLQYIKRERKRKKIKGQLIPVSDFNSGIETVEDILGISAPCFFSFISFSFSGDWNQVVTRLQKSQQRLPLF